METAIIKTPIGYARIVGDAEGISEISVLDGGIVTQNIPAVLGHCTDELIEFFEGTRSSFTFVMNPKGTPFQQRVWKALLEIPYGTTVSYHQLATKLGDVKAIRAVAAANGRNPLWIATPCHRVIGSDGLLTGYAGGLWRKKWLLEHECPPVQQSLF